MNNRMLKIADILLSATREKFSDSFLNVPEALFYWHNTIYLFFSSINHQKLFNVTDAGYDEMRGLKLMPDYLIDFFNKDRTILEKYINEAAKEFFAAQVNINYCRQELLNIEIDFTGSKISLFLDKVSRDNTGSYYTPKELAGEITKKVFSQKHFKHNKEYKIADFSCGGGDFFLSLMDFFKLNLSIDFSNSVRWFYGVDIDPIALQICIVNLLQYANRNDWETIISHFTFGNPLIINNDDVSEEEKNVLFATRRLYSVGLGLPNSFFDDTYDLVIGNPPWEKIRFEERKFFRGIVNDIALLSQKNIRDTEVQKLKHTWPSVYHWRNTVFNDYSQMTSTKYRHCKIRAAISGELNTYSLFTELAYNMLSHNGLLALIVKSTLVTAPVHQKLWTMFLSNNSVAGIYLFENKNKIFSIDSRERFIVFVATREYQASFEFITGLSKARMLSAYKPIFLTANIVSKINPFTNTIPNVSNNQEISFLMDVHNRFRLFSEIYPKCHFGRLIHLTAHAASIEKTSLNDNIPIYEGKFIEQYDARYATFRGMPDSKKYANKASAIKTVLMDNGKKELPEARYYVHKDLWDKYLRQYDKKYSLCWRSLTSPTNKRTMLAMILQTCPTCQSIQMLQTENDTELIILLALFNSIPFDYLVRIKMPGLDLTQSVIKQIPVPSDDDYNKIIEFNGKQETLKKHILSYTISILKEEDRLSDLISKFENVIYDVNPLNKNEKQTMIDLLFKKAYHLDDLTYENILSTFPKYQANHIV